MIITPPYLDKKHPTMALVAPSFGVNAEPYFSSLEKTIKNLVRSGFNIKVGPNVYLADGVVASNTPEARAREFMDAYEDEDVDLIVSVGGGETMCEILPYIGFEKLKSLPPKWFMGFSDNTNLVYTLTTLSGIKAIYGPCAPSFFDYPYRYDLLDALRLLRGEKEFVSYPKWTMGKSEEDKPLAKPQYRKLAKPKAYGYNKPIEGTLLGGCLDCISNLMGTPYMRFTPFIEENAPTILFLECCDLNPLSFRRALFQLREAGYFQGCALLLLGRPFHYGEKIFGVSFESAALDMLGNLGFPIVFDFSLGHLPPSMPLINGAKARVEVLESGQIKLTYLD